MRPKIKFLNHKILNKICDEAYDVLCIIGIEIHNNNILSLLQDHGAKIDIDTNRAFLTHDIINNAIRTVPASFKLYDVNENKTHDFKDHNVYFTPGSTSLNILDYKENKIRRANTKDVIEHIKITSQLENIASQSTAIIPSDVPETISDSYRLFLSFLYCSKPVVTGAFTIDSWNAMKNLQLAIRGTRKNLEKKPLTIFSCCPTSPLKWCDVTSQNVVDCAKYKIPIEFIAMPLSGFMAPVTLMGTIVQHTAETLSGVVISQLTNPGAPILYGGSPAIFDVRFETTPMGAIETMMIDCAYNEVGKYLKMPTQAYTSFSDSKRLDAQAGLESGMGATLAALAGINNISGPGMLDFESCQSLEKLVLDNEICGMTLRMIKGIEIEKDFPMLSIFKELLNEKHLLISDHTRKHIKKEHFVPGPVIDRKNLERWKNDNSISLNERAHIETKKLLKNYQPISLSKTIKNDLYNTIKKECSRCGIDFKHNIQNLFIGQ